MPDVATHRHGRSGCGLLLVHGLGGSHHTWDAVAPLLADTFQVATVDLAGFGATPRHGDLGIPAQARRLAAALRGLDIPLPTTVVGHSLGGAVAVALAEQSPHLVSSLALVNPTPVVGARLAARGWRERGLAAPYLGALLWRLASDRQLAAGLRTAFAPGFPVPSAAVADLRATTARAVTASSKALDHYLAQRPLPARVAALGVPTLLVYGTADRRVAVAAFGQFTTADMVVRLPGVGHSPPYEAPALVAKSLRVWLGRR